ncbi:hypothetical protein GCM10010464_58710 [Pseudonocardia yunnanensis]
MAAGLPVTTGSPPGADPQPASTAIPTSAAASAAVHRRVLPWVQPSRRGDLRLDIRRWCHRPEAVAAARAAIGRYAENVHPDQVIRWACGVLIGGVCVMAAAVARGHAGYMPRRSEQRGQS